MLLLTVGQVVQEPELFHRVLRVVVLVINSVTVAVLTWGVLYGLVRFVVTEGKRLVGSRCEWERTELRRQVGFYLLFALELLIAADVIETMLDPSLEHIGVLGAIAVIRIVIGYALGTEINHLEREAVHE